MKRLLITLVTLSCFDLCNNDFVFSMAACETNVCKQAVTLVFQNCQDGCMDDRPATHVPIFKRLHKFDED